MVGSLMPLRPLVLMSTCRGARGGGARCGGAKAGEGAGDSLAPPRPNPATRRRPGAHLVAAGHGLAHHLAAAGPARGGGGGGRGKEDVLEGDDGAPRVRVAPAALSSCCQCWRWRCQCRWRCWARGRASEELCWCSHNPPHTTTTPAPPLTWPGAPTGIASGQPASSLWVGLAQGV